MTNKRSLTALALAATMLFGPSLASAGWVPANPDTSIKNVITFHSGEPRVLIVADNGTVCYFDSASGHGPQVMSMVLSAFLSKRKVNLYCFDTENKLVIAGITAHMVHRLELK
jgi:hypothetical protein